MVVVDTYKHRRESNETGFSTYFSSRFQGVAARNRKKSIETWFRTLWALWNDEFWQRHCLKWNSLENPVYLDLKCSREKDFLFSISMVASLCHSVFFWSRTEDSVDAIINNPIVSEQRKAFLKPSHINDSVSIAYIRHSSVYDFQRTTK